MTCPTLAGVEGLDTRLYQQRNVPLDAGVDLVVVVYVIRHFQTDPLPGPGPSFRQDRHGRIVTVQPAGGHDVTLEPRVQRRQRRGVSTDLVGQSREADVHAYAGVALGLPVQRLGKPPG